MAMAYKLVFESPDGTAEPAGRNPFATKRGALKSARSLAKAEWHGLVTRIIVDDENETMVAAFPVINQNQTT
jgi:hypothetical protein